MNAKTFYSVVMFAGGAGLAVIAWQQAGRARATRMESGKIAAQEAAVRSDLKRTEQRLAAAERQRAARRAEIDALPGRTVAIPQPKAPPAAPARRSMNILEIIRNEPDAEAFYLESRRSQLAAKYGPLLRSLGLRAEAAAKFQDIYIKREEAQMDLADVLRTKGTQESGAAVAKLMAAAEAEYEAAQRELMGEAGYRQLQDYERTSSMRGMVSAIAGVAAVEHVPFSAAQADALVRTIAETSLGYRNGGFATISDIDWETVDAQARAILSPEQFDVYRTMDPGPTRGGLLQNRMYALVDSAKRAEAKQVAPAAAAPPKPPGG